MLACRKGEEAPEEYERVSNDTFKLSDVQEEYHLYRKVDQQKNEAGREKVMDDRGKLEMEIERTALECDLLAKQLE